MSVTKYMLKKKKIIDEQQKQSSHVVGKKELKGDHFIDKPLTNCLYRNRNAASAMASPSRRKPKTSLATQTVYIHSFKHHVFSLESTAPKISYRRRHPVLLATAPKPHSFMGRNIRKQPYSLLHTEGTARGL